MALENNASNVLKEYDYWKLNFIGQSGCVHFKKGAYAASEILDQALKQGYIDRDEYDMCFSMECITDDDYELKHFANISFELK